MIDEDEARRQPYYSISEAAARLAGVHPRDAPFLDPESPQARDMRHMQEVVRFKIAESKSPLAEPFSLSREPRASRALVRQIARTYGIQNDLLPFDYEEVRSHPRPPSPRPDPSTPRRSAKLRLLIAASDATVAARERASDQPQPTHKQQLIDYLRTHADEYGVQISDTQLEDMVTIANLDPTPGRPAAKK